MGEYVNVPEETDPDILAQDAFEYLTSKVATWQPNDAQLDTWVIAACARMIALLKDTASDVRTGIFRWFGAMVFGLPPIEASRATSATNWILTDEAGHSIPEGTTLSIPNSAGELQPFETTAEAVVPPGSKEAKNVPIQAVNEGSDSNGIGAPGTVCTLEDQYAWAQEGGITLTATTSGGVDEESDESYLNRLVNDIRLMALAPIVAADYASLARNVQGVHRAVAINLYNPETFAHKGKVTTGSFKVEELGEEFVNKCTIGTEISGAGIPIGAKVTGLEPKAGGGTVVISIKATATFLLAEITAVGKIGQEKCVTIGVVGEEGVALSAEVKAEVKQYLAERREVNYLIFVVDPTYTTIDVEFEVKCWPGWETASVEARCATAIEEFLNPGKWGLPPFGDEQVWYNREQVKINDIIAQLGGVQGVKDVNSAKIRRHAVGAYEPIDITLNGVAALVKSGTVEGVAV